MHVIPSRSRPPSPTFFFFTDTATTAIYTLSLHDALPILPPARAALARRLASALATRYAITLDASGDPEAFLDRKSTRLNSSHLGISYAVFCLKKKKKEKKHKKEKH